MKHLLLIGHGSQDEESRQAYQKLAAEVREAIPHFPVHLCFLELQEPGIEEGVAACLEAGAEEIHVFPLILSKGGHYQNDIPKQLQEARRTNPDVPVYYGAPLGEHPLFAQTAAAEIERAGAADQLLVVSQGSTAPDGNLTAEQLTAALRQQFPDSEVTAAFMTGDGPLYSESLKQLDSSALIIPNFLFSGTMYKQLKEKAGGRRVTRCLGTGGMFLELLVDHLLKPAPLLQPEKTAATV